jgi:hypothetical protein
MKKIAMLLVISSVSLTTNVYSDVNNSKKPSLPTYQDIKKGKPELNLKYHDCLNRNGVMIIHPKHHERATCVQKKEAPLHKMM